MKVNNPSLFGEEPLATTHGNDLDDLPQMDRGLDLRVVVGAVVVLLVLVGLMVWLVPSTLGAGTVNITVRQ